MPEYDIPSVPPLKSDTFNEIDLVGATAGTIVLTEKVSGDAQYRLTQTADGSVSMGPGDGTYDVVLARTAVNTYVIGASATEGLEISFAGSLLQLAEKGAIPGRTMQIGTNNAKNVNIMTSGGAQWTFGSLTGGGTSFYPASDNAQDLGLASLKPRDIRFGRQMIGPVGSAGTPAYVMVGGLTTGMYTASVGSDISFSIAGTRMFAIQANNIQIISDTAQIFFGLAADTILTRDAANVLAMKNSTTAQTFRVYGTTTGPKYTSIAHNGTDGVIDANNGKLTLGGAANVWLGAGVGLFFTTDNAADIGASGTARPRDCYLSSSVSIGTNPSATGSVRIAYATAINSRNSANSSDIQLIAASTVNTVVDVVTVGGGAGVLGVARSKAGAPTTSDIPSGQWSVWRDTSGATTKLYYNNAGTLQSVALV